MRAGMVNAKQVIVTFHVNQNLSVGASARFVSELPVLEAKISTTIGAGNNRSKRQQKYRDTKNYYRTRRSRRF